MFQRDDYVFYESGGICKIVDIQVSPLDSMPQGQTYYVLQSVHENNGVMYIPVNSDKIFLRRLLTRQEADLLLDEIESIDAINEPNVKLLRNKYIEAMHTHLPKEWIRIIKTVYKRTNADSLRPVRISDTERSFGENAKRYLYAELALAFGIEPVDVEAFITNRIEQKMAE